MTAQALGTAGGGSRSDSSSDSDSDSNIHSNSDSDSNSNRNGKAVKAVATLPRSLGAAGKCTGEAPTIDI